MAFTLDRYGHLYDHAGDALASGLEALAGSTLSVTQDDLGGSTVVPPRARQAAGLGTALARTRRPRLLEALDKLVTWDFLVGDTGLEPVTSSVSRKRASQTAPIARAGGARGGDGI